MSGATAAAWVGAAVAAGSAIANNYQQNKQNRQAKAAAAEQKRQSDLALAQQDQDFNRVNRQQANIEGLLDANTQQGTGTSLTGIGGAKIDPLKLGGGSGLLGG